MPNASINKKAKAFKGARENITGNCCFIDSRLGRPL